MNRHELEPLSLFSGLIFVIVAGGYALTETTSLRLHWLLVVPVLLVLVGATVIATVVRRLHQPVSETGTEAGVDAGVAAADNGTDERTED